MTSPPPIGPKPASAQQPSPITTGQLHAWIARRQRFRSRIKTLILFILVVGVGAIVTIWTLFHEQLITKGRLEAVGFMVDWDIDPTNIWQGGETSVTYARRWNQDERAGVSDLPLLKSLLHLCSLDLESLDSLNEDDLAVLADLNELTDLQLHRSPSFNRKESQVKLNDAVIEHIKGLTKLKTLSLADNRITDAGVAKLANLSELESLDLDSTRITDAGLQSLVALKKLRFLRVVKTRVTRAGVSAFQQVMTSTEVTSEDAPMGLDN